MRCVSSFIITLSSYRLFCQVLFSSLSVAWMPLTEVINIPSCEIIFYFLEHSVAGINKCRFLNNYSKVIHFQPLRRRRLNVARNTTPQILPSNRQMLHTHETGVYNPGRDDSRSRFQGPLAIRLAARLLFTAQATAIFGVSC